MKFCYLDESGTGDEPFAVLVGVIVDAQRMHKTKAEWKALLDDLSRIIGREVPELHTRDFYPGNGLWRGIDGSQRAKIITAVLQWIADRRHKIIYACIDKEKFATECSIGKIPPEIDTLWRALGYYVILGLQKEHQKKEKTKGHTVLVFDNEERERAKFTDLILAPPAWSDSFYRRPRRSPRLSHIVDVPYWADSREVALIQVADFVAYFIRRYLEITEGKIPPRYPGEDDRIEQWMELIDGVSYPKAVLYPSRGRCETAELFWSLLPTTKQDV